MKQLILLCFVLISNPLLSQGRQSSSSERPPDPPPCTAEIQFLNPRAEPVQTDMVLISIRTTASRPANDCLPADVHLTATYIDLNDDPICSGTIERIFQLTADSRFPFRLGHVDVAHLEIKPQNVLEFARWRNALVPTPSTTPPKRLFCSNLDGTSEITDFSRAAFLKLHATILPKSNGVATAETRLILIGRP